MIDLREQNSCWSFALFQHTQVFLNEGLDRTFCNLLVLCFKVDKTMAHLRVCASTTCLDCNCNFKVAAISDLEVTTFFLRRIGSCQFLLPDSRDWLLVWQITQSKALCSYSETLILRLWNLRVERCLQLGYGWSPRRTSLLLNLNTCLADDYHGFIVRHWRWWSVLALDRDYVIYHYPWMVSSCKNSVNVFGSNVRNMLKSCPWILIVQTSKGKFKLSKDLQLTVVAIPSCIDISLWG